MHGAVGGGAGIESLRHERARRNALGLVAIALVVGCGAREVPGPNLLLICIDTVRLDVFELVGEASPDDALEGWVESAIRLRGARSTSPWTLPAVASVLTGLDAGQHGAGRFEHDVANLDRMLPSGLPDELPTLPALLRDAGFDTVALVAHPWFSEGFGLQRGFGELLQLSEQADIVERAAERLAAAARQGDRPFFLYLHFMEAHQHFQLDREARRRRLDGLPESLRAAALRSAPGDICAKPGARLCGTFLSYVSAVAELRAAVATLLEALEREGLLDDTLVVLYSDHGEEFHDHRAAQRETSSDPRGLIGLGHGHTLYGELLRVPLLVWHPELEGRSLEAPVSLIDLVPTALEWLGLASAAESRLPGIPIRSLVERELTTRAPERLLFASGIAYGEDQHSVERGRWKRVARSGPGPDLLFDLANDPQENASLRRPRVAAELDRVLERRFETARGASSGSPEIEPADLERLRELGYLREAEGARSTPE